MKNLDSLKRHLDILQIPHIESENLARHTTIRIGGLCELMVFPRKKVELIEILRRLEEEEYPYCVIGGGSNLLISDEGFRGIVVCLKNFRGIKRVKETKEKITFRVSSGTMINELVSIGLREGFEGLEFLACVPATVGGAVKMNAGAFGKSVSMFVKRICLYHRGNLEEIAATENLWEYRKFKKEGIVVEVELEFYKGKKEGIKRRVLEYLEKRKKTQPIEKRTFGSVFKNPPCYYAGQLIEACGLKGYRVGEAEVSKKHANFIVNLGKAKARDVLEIMKVCKRRVYEKFKVNLEPEVKFLGFNDGEMEEFN